MTNARRPLYRPAFALLLIALCGPEPGSAWAQKPGRSVPTEAGYELAFVDADARRVVDAVLGTMMGADYSIDPAVTGNITLRTARPVRRAELVPLLEQALRGVGAVILIDGSRYRIVPRENARMQVPVPTAAPEPPGAVSEAGEGDGFPPLAPGFASESFDLKAAAAPQIAKLIEQMVGKDVVTGVEAAGNRITVAGSAEERSAVRQIIRRFDVDTLANMTFEFYKLDNVDADTLLAELQRVFQPPYDILGSRVRVLALPRLRSLLVIAADRADIARVDPWIRRLDTGVAGKRRLYSYAIQNGRARDIARALQLVIGDGRDNPAGEQMETAAPPSLDDRSTTDMGRPGDGGDAESDARAVVAQRREGGRGPRIVPNDATNSILIHADGEEYELIRDALSKLDQPVAQVLIEATLAEVTLDKELQYGVNFRGLTGDATFVNSSSTSTTPAALVPGFSVSLLTNSISSVLNSLQSKTQVRVLSAPKLMVLNNQTATLQVGDQVPIVTQQAQSVASPGAPIVNSVELRDTGVILRVTPRVNDSGTVTLEISQEVSDVSQTTSSGINSPTIQQRKLTSTVATRSGQMVALGGLIRERAERTRSGIPLLSQIPLVGGLFGNHTRGGGRTELIILLTPTVVRSPEDVGGIVDELIGRLDQTRPLIDRAREGQIGGPQKKE